VSAEGFEIEDSVASYIGCIFIVIECIFTCIGLTFWKCPRRKLFAVTVSDIEECNLGHNRSRDDSDVSDDELAEPFERTGRTRYDKMLHQLNDEVASVRGTIMTSLTKALARDATLPMGFKRIIKDTFKYQICHSTPMVLPVIVTKCCKNLLGCKTCVDTKYSGADAMSKSCPVCRAERARQNEIMIIRGLVDLMEAVKGMIERQNSAEGEVSTTNKQTEQ